MTPRIPNRVPGAAELKRLRALRKAGLTMTEVAEKYGVTTQAISQVVRGTDRSAPLEHFIEELLGVARYSLFPERP